MSNDDYVTCTKCGHYFKDHGRYDPDKPGSACPQSLTTSALSRAIDKEFRRVRRSDSGGGNLNCLAIERSGP